MARLFYGIRRGLEAIACLKAFWAELIFATWPALAGDTDGRASKRNYHYSPRHLGGAGNGGAEVVRTA